LARSNEVIEAPVVIGLSWNSMKPRVAIPLPTSTNADYNQRSWPQYAAAVERSGGQPVEIPLNATPVEIANLINTCQAVLLPGSPADVNPQKYGHDPIPETAPPDLPRENVDELLLQDAHNLYKPIFAICFGIQILNVWRGGTLVQDLSVLPVNHSAGKQVAIAHTAAVAPESLLGALLTPEEAPAQENFSRLPINSSHHQAIGIAGDGLRISARCPQDAVIEAVEGGQATEGATAHFVLGVQWHPERSYDLSPASRALFDRFIAEAKAWQPRPIHTSVEAS
jgi:putative glutamine amidotransferase